MHASKSTEVAGALKVGLIVALNVLLIASIYSTEARYLPTRADETDVEVLRDLIKGLIIQSNLDQMESRMQSRFPQASSRFNDDKYYHQIERRAAELPVMSNGDPMLNADPSMRNLNNVKA